MMRSGNRSPGGVDNAGSVAIVLELARLLPREVGPDVELIFLCTSAEEDHMIGAMRYLDAHIEELGGRPVRALNFDGAGSPGDAVLLESYGVGRRFAPEIARVARDVARRAGVRLRRVWMPPAMGVDAIPFHHRGVPCLTFSSGSLGRATAAVHSSADVADNLDAATLARVASIAREVARRIAAP
jgi:Zn-dependent M28 family amino/carboxypeptidase